MPQSFFIWNGVDCRAKGIIMQGPAAIIRPEERVNHVEIPGRAGDLTETEGENIYNSYIQTVPISVRGGSYRVREIFQWLRGAGEVTFSGEPDRKQDARVIGAITLNRHSRNRDNWEGEVQFYCQPLKKRLSAHEIAVTSGDVVRNDGDVESRPRWRVKTKANLGSSETVTLTVAGGNTITLTGAESAKWYMIDAESMTVTNWNLQETQSNYTSLSSGDFPTLAVGANTVTFTNCSECHVLTRERFL